MRKETYYKILMVIISIDFINVLYVTLAGPYFYHFPISAIDILMLIIILISFWLTFIKKFLGVLIFFIFNAYGYFSFFNFGLTGFSIPNNVHWQPLFNTWLELFSMAFCVIGWLFTLRSKKYGH